ncbi:MAG TPA: class I SAM-dependent methyltransferase [Isosphaeraceae bacterium]|jgi:SAM-dependent methyltransferase|nr:class I SAM-dependent methyltransferase [Isosphaeraceae bacterium]
MRVDAPDRSPTAAELARCLACAAALGGRPACPRCGREHPDADGILDAIDLPLAGTNRVAAAFYDGPGWARFRPWERLFLTLQGGQNHARMQILRHLPAMPFARVLEVGIGDGDNLPLLPAGWDVYGVDIARGRLEACRDRFPGMSGRLVWAEGEALPFPDATFDAAYSIGGFNYFRDHAAALRELRRVVLPGAATVVADELPNLHHWTIGHWIGWPGLTAWFLRRVGLDAEFAAMVLAHRASLDAIARAAWPGHRRYRIWNRLGYCLVDDGSVGEVPRCP